MLAATIWILFHPNCSQRNFGPGLFLIHLFCCGFLLMLCACRYFFKLELLTKGSLMSLDDDDEEDLTWDEDNKTSGDGADPAAGSIQSAALEADNAKLKQCVRSLTRRVAELESELREKDIQLNNALRQLSELNSVGAGKGSALPLEATSQNHSITGSNGNTETSSSNALSSRSTSGSMSSNESSRGGGLGSESPQAATAAALSTDNNNANGASSVVVRRNDSVSSISDAETASDSSSVVVVGSGHHGHGSGHGHGHSTQSHHSSSSFVNIPRSDVGVAPATAQAQKATLASTMVSLEESDDEDGGWS